MTMEKDVFLKVMSLKEVSQHTSPGDYWIVLFNKIYDVSEFIKEHPGGFDIILEYVGRDASLAFLGSGHSHDAFLLLENYCIGIIPKHERIPSLNQKIYDC
nr:cytochrome b5-like [Lepeophtheirus salmonis]ADD38035.1 Cytochrome b5 [Lepeophtheirus salmonis]